MTSKLPRPRSRERRRTLFGNAIQLGDPRPPRGDVRAVLQRRQDAPPRVGQRGGGRGVAHGDDGPVALIAPPPVVEETCDLLPPERDQPREGPHAGHERLGVRLAHLEVVAGRPTLVRLLHVRLGVED